MPAPQAVASDVPPEQPVASAVPLDMSGPPAPQTQEVASDKPPEVSVPPATQRRTTKKKLPPQVQGEVVTPPANMRRIRTTVWSNKCKKSQLASVKPEEPPHDVTAADPVHTSPRTSPQGQNATHADADSGKSGHSADSIRNACLTMFDFCGHYMKAAETLVDITEYPCEVLSDQMNDFRYSTAYSGIDTPGSSLMMMVQQVRRSRWSVIEPQHVFAFEKDLQCQQELSFHPNAPACIFKDLDSLWVKQAAQKIALLRAQGMTISLQSLLPLVRSGRSIKHESACCIHNKSCPLKKSDIHIAGPSCCPFSTMNQSGATTDASEMTAMAAWVAMNLHLEPKVIICEESDKFTEDMLRDCFSTKYAVVSDVLCGTMFGWCGRRRRFWGVCVHLSIVSDAVSSFRNMRKVFQRACDISYHDLFNFMSDQPDVRAELESELRWAAGRENSRAHHIEWEELITRDDKYELALTQSEYDNMMAYKSALEPGCTFMLNQTFDRGHGIHSTPTVFHTIIRNTSIQFSSTHRRWCTPLELLAMMGHPVLPILTDNVPCCSFSRREGVPSSRKRVAMLNQAGNSMQACVCTAVLMWVLLVVRPRGRAKDRDTESTQFKSAESAADDCLASFLSACKRARPARS